MNSFSGSNNTLPLEGIKYANPHQETMPESFGDRLRRIREEKRLNQAEFAEKTGEGKAAGFHTMCKDFKHPSPSVGGSDISKSTTSESWIGSMIMISEFNVALTEEEIQEELRNPGSITRGRVGRQRHYD